jgi:hypothetical protein
MAVLHNHKQCSNKPIYLPFDPVLKKYGGTGRSPRNKLRSIGPSWTFKTALRLRSIEPKKKRKENPHAMQKISTYLTIRWAYTLTRRRFWVLSLDPMGPARPPAKCASASDLRHRISHLLPIAQPYQLSSPAVAASRSPIPRIFSTSSPLLRHTHHC